MSRVFGFEGSGRRFLLGWGGPELRFGLATGFEAWADCAGGLVPAEQLLAGVAVTASVEDLEERGRGQAAGAEVEAEIGEGVELALGEGDLDQAQDGLLGFQGVLGENFGGMGFGDFVGKRLVREEAMAVADGGEASYVEVGSGAKALGFFDQVESGCA